MQLRSLGYRSDLLFVAHDGEVHDRGRYLVVKTLSNPNFFWGNLLIFDRPPRAGDLATWKDVFHAEFPDPRIYHVTLAWDSPEGDLGDTTELEADGFTIEKDVVLTASDVHLPPRYHPDVEIRPLATSGEREEVIQLQTAAGGPHLSRAAWESFYRSQSRRYLRMVQAGRGQWFGAFLDGRAVGTLGAFHDGQGGIARFQHVSTHPDYQRRGICGSLVHATAKYALENFRVRQLVVVADEEYHAARIYQAVGFRPVEKKVGACWWDRSRTT